MCELQCNIQRDSNFQWRRIGIACAEGLPDRRQKRQLQKEDNAEGIDLMHEIWTFIIFNGRSEHEYVCCKRCGYRISLPDNPEGYSENIHYDSVEDAFSKHECKKVLSNRASHSFRLVDPYTEWRKSPVQFKDPNSIPSNGFFPMFFKKYQCMRCFSFAYAININGNLHLSQEKDVSCERQQKVSRMKKVLG